VVKQKATGVLRVPRFGPAADIDRDVNLLAHSGDSCHATGVKAAFLRRHPGKLVLLALVAVTTVVTLAVHALRFPDPVCEGKRLSQWLAIWCTARERFSVDEQKRPEDAIRHLGTNAVPSLLIWMDYETPLARHPLLAKLFGCLPKSVMFSSPVQRALDTRKQERLAQSAMDALQLLGPDANCAIPELARRVTTSRPRSGRDRALVALTRFGQPAVPTIALALRDETMAELWTAGCLRNLGTNAKPLVPVIVQNLLHTNPQVVRWNAYFLGELKLDPDLAVPALVERLTDAHREVRWTAADSLGEFGPLSASGLAALTNALVDPDRDVRHSAARAISEITRGPQADL
jgi:hypothetical protein